MSPGFFALVDPFCAEYLRGTMSAEIATLHVPFREFLRRGKYAYTYHRPDRPTGATLGDADFILYCANRVLMIEFKDKETKVSKVQVQRHAELAATGTIVHILRELPAAITLVTEWRSMIGAVILPTVLTRPAAEEKIFAGCRWRLNPETGRYERGEKIAA